MSITYLTIDGLDVDQRIAVEQCIDPKRRCAGVTGPAGSGKTTIIRTAVKLIEEAGYTFALCAPTGKAARRMKEATGYDALTIHKLLEYTQPTDINPKTGRPYGGSYPRRDKSNPLDVDFVFCDEYAMVPRDLHRNLVDALQAGCRLRVFGDVRQLPPIEENAAVAKEKSAFVMILEKFNGVQLTKIHRQGEDSDVLFNAQRILEGKSPQNKPNFELVITGTGNTPVDAVLSRLDRCDWASLDNQIITPSNKSWIGTYKLSQAVQNMLFDDDRETMALPRRKYQGKQFTPDIRVGVGDKLIMVKNWYNLDGSDGSKGVFNGETGIVVSIDVDEGMITIDFGDRLVTIPPAIETIYNDRVLVGYPQEDLLLAYVVTTHKSQGSEYDNIMYVIDKSVTVMLNRRNLYTAVTRARRQVYLVTDMRSLGTAVTVKEPRIF